MSGTTEERIFDVEITTTRYVHVRVPADVLNDGEDAEDAAEEFALGGKTSWPEYVISEEASPDVETVTEIHPQRGSTP